MGLIKAAMGAAGGVLADQWKEYFYCDAIDVDTLLVKGQKRVSGRSSNTKGSDNIISSGSVISVGTGQAMIITEQGKIVEFCAEPGEFVFDNSTEPSIFSGSFGESVKKTFANVGKRFTFGGEAPKDQRVYFVNTRELTGNKYGTASPVPFRVVDASKGIDVDISVKCFGEYSYQITDPLLFFTFVGGNVSEDYKRDALDGQLKTELLTALQPAFGRLSDMGIRYSAVVSHTVEIADALNDILSKKWKDLRGIEIVSFGVSSIKASEEDEQMLKELQTYSNPTLAAARTVAAQADAMKIAAGNQGGMGAMGAFMGMNMAQQQGGMNAQQLFAMGQQQQMQQQQMQQQQMAQQAAPVQPAAADAWTCTCGATATGKFCPECGAAKPAPAASGDGWTCSCGAVNKGKFCSECGTPKPAGVPQYRCDKCGWEPEDKAHPPKFCPECGDPFDDGDIVK